MPRFGRSALYGDNNTVFPTNNAKSIIALEHRGYNINDIDSFFNWIDDQLKDAIYDQSTGDTLDEYLNDPSTGVLTQVQPLAQGTVIVGDISSSGTCVTTGDFTNPSIKTQFDVSTEVSVVFTSALPDTNYLPIIMMSTNGAANNQAMSGLSWWGATTTGFNFKISEWAAEGQNVKCYITVVKFNG